MWRRWMHTLKHWEYCDKNGMPRYLYIEFHCKLAWMLIGNENIKCEIGEGNDAAEDLHCRKWASIWNSTWNEFVQSKTLTFHSSARVKILMKDVNVIQVTGCAASVIKNAVWAISLSSKILSEQHFEVSIAVN